MKKMIICSSFILLCIQIFAQADKGVWTYTNYPNGIIKINWENAGLQHAEQISDAVIAKAIAPPSTKIADREFAKVSMVDNLLIVKAGKLFVMFEAGFDSGRHRGVRIKLQDGEQLFGAGERATALNRRGQRLPLNNNAWYGYGEGADALNYSVPLLLSTSGYALFFDNPSKGYFDIGKSKPDILEAGFESGSVDVYIIPGNNMDEMLRNYTLLTGRQPLPPRWALGNLMSRFGYRTQDQLEGIVKDMKKDSFPIDGVILDLFWFGDSIKGTLGNLDWNRAKWPQPEKMIANLKKQNINTILITEPFVLKETKAYKSSLPYLSVDSLGKPYDLKTFYFGKGGLIDLFRPEAKEWFWQYYKKQINNGVAGWWGDLGEPENHPADLYHNLKSFGVNRLMSANEVHNIYGAQWSKMLFQHYKKEYPNTRLFFLNRAGYAGSQRYSIFPWTGDVSRSWGGLRATLQVLQGMSLSGVPYVHSDAGGFGGGENDPELYTRWLQFATFTPIFRPHGTALGDLEPTVLNIPSEPSFQQEPYKSIVRNTIKLRYSLLPYNYSLAYEQTTTGKPLMRPMFYYNSSDTNLLKANGQYMWGDALLVAPVVEKGAVTKSIYLPEGMWYDLNKSEWKEGGKWITDSVNIEHTPLYAKAGSFLPSWNNDTCTSTSSYSMAQPLIIRYILSADSSKYVLFEDDGKSRNSIDSGNYSLITFTAEKIINYNEFWEVTIKATKWPAGLKRKITFEIPGCPQCHTINQAFKSVYVNGEYVPGKFDGAFQKADFVFDGKPVVINIQQFGH